MGKKIGYWITTGLICATQLMAAFMELSRNEEAVKGITELGYPTYILTIIGSFKVLGIVALLTPPRHPVINRIREWAYVGFAIDFIGATASHALNGDAFSNVAGAGIFTIILGVSYALLPTDRRLIAAPASSEGT